MKGLRYNLNPQVPPSSSGSGCQILSLVTGVRVPLGVLFLWLKSHGASPPPYEANLRSGRAGCSGKKELKVILCFAGLNDDD